MLRYKSKHECKCISSILLNSDVKQSDISFFPNNVGQTKHLFASQLWVAGLWFTGHHTHKTGGGGGGGGYMYDHRTGPAWTVGPGPYSEAHQLNVLVRST